MHNHAPDIAAIDLFVVPTVGFDLLYGLVIVRLGRRDLVWTNVTANPTAEWVARQITEAFPWDEAPHYLIRDRIYGSVVTRRLRAMGIRDKPTAPVSPWQNGVAERLIGSIRRECVDHIIVVGEMHLRYILRSYARYYNDIKTHRFLNKDAPVSRPVQRTGVIVHVPCWADFITTTPVFKFSVHSALTKELGKAMPVLGISKQRDKCATSAARSADDAVCGPSAGLTPLGPKGMAAPKDVYGSIFDIADAAVAAEDWPRAVSLAEQISEDLGTIRNLRARSVLMQLRADGSLAKTNKLKNAKSGL